jgi:hypothetical protein
MTQIPLLIQEKLDYYLWKNRVQELNNEYINIFIINQNGLLIYKCDLRSKNSYLYRALNGRTYACCVYDKCIRQFNVPFYFTEIELPTKYNYSSGLEDRNGYRMSFFQELEMESQKRKSEKLLKEKLELEEQKLFQQKLLDHQFIINSTPVVILYLGFIFICFKKLIENPITLFDS